MCLQLNPVTMLGIYEMSGVRKGGWLLQTAANSVLGRMMISYCKHNGVKTINIVRRPKAKKAVLDAG